MGILHQLWRTMSTLLIPVIHERLLQLLIAFLQIKNIYGRKRKEIYKEAGIIDLVDRLLKKRPIVFYCSSDNYVLREDQIDGCGGFEHIGHSHGSTKLSIKEYMSYDEIKLAALVGVSSKSHFINDGSRCNRGNPGIPGTFQPSGVIIGLVGARFEKPGYMEWQDCLVTNEQNKAEHGYGPVIPEKYLLVREWGKLWGENYLPTWEEVQDSSKEGFTQITSKILLNNKIYKSRIQMSAEILLAEARTRAEEASMKAYIHIVGLGLGVWQVDSAQSQLFVEAWGDAIIAQKDTSSIGHIDFSYIHVDQCHSVSNGETFPNTDITIHFSKRSLHDPVPEGNLLIVSYAWDGNSMPGNEYWRGELSSSGDPSAACSSGVAELHNALINTHVTASNLHIATASGVTHVGEYARNFLQKHSEDAAG
ncbi:unnamed protein product [Meganyctiphanes norvegica]|uniref:Uncharacterized protein n=1 Tax=Meganyctiphanes norvegica TaxID=48144 RepID=A0AAV2R3S5_MEGNR